MYASLSQPPQTPPLSDPAAFARMMHNTASSMPGFTPLAGGRGAPWTYLLKSTKIDDKVGAKGSTVEAFYCEPYTDYDIPDRVYGRVKSIAERIITTHESRDSTTGVLLIGTQGSGKTLLMKLISRLARERLGLPTLIINSCFYGDAFNAFIATKVPPCVIIFDEFEKVYRQYGAQEALLTLYDGLFSSNKLMVHTANDERAINPHYINRPGRIYYRLKHVGISKSFAREYCDENLKNKAEMTDILQIVSEHRNFSFDMLQALVEEMNRYGEPARSAIQMLNITPGADMKYKVEVFVDQTKVPTKDILTQDFSGSMFDNDSVTVMWRFNPGGPAGDPNNPFTGGGPVSRVEISSPRESLTSDPNINGYVYRDENVIVNFIRETIDVRNDILDS